MATVLFDEATRLYPKTSKPAVDHVTLEIADGEFLVLVGPSGCGKSTTLRMLAGLEPVDSGRILIDGHDQTGVRPRDRDIAMVFQSYALYPNMSAAENMAFALENAKLGKDEVRSRVAEAAKILELEDLLDKKPGQMSGGQRQRVAMGRAIVRQPQAFLLDEPLSNLDAKLRVGMRASLAQLHQRLGVTTVYVTHDQTEAMTLGQRVAVMRDGHILQCDKPSELYARPNDLFIAAFIGSPAMNLVEAFPDGETVRFGQFSLPAPRVPRAERIVLGIRPEAFSLGNPTLPTIDVRVEVVEDLGSEMHLFFRVDAQPITAESLESASEQGLLGENLALFTARVDAGSAVAVGSTVALGVDASRFHYFDADSGARLTGEPMAALAGAQS
jgi:ABC-type sugar transport system ATPase subunit